MAHTDVRKQEFIAAVATVAAIFAERWYEGGGNTPIVLSPPPASDDAEPLVGRKEAARMLRVSVSTLDRFAKAGEISPVRITGRTPKFKKADIERLIRRRQ